MSLSRWKELAQRKTKAGRAVNELYDDITEEKIRSKTTDAAIAKTFRLDRLDRLDQIAEQTKPKQRRRVPLRPRVDADGGIDYAPEVDPYEEMDVEGLLNLEDYVPPQAEKQIAKAPQKLPQYEMDPSFWQIPDEPPPPYEEEEELEEMDDNQLLEQMDLPNFDDVEKRLAEPEMTEERRRNYLRKVQKDAENRQRQAAVIKTHAANAYKRGEITRKEMDEAYAESDRLQKPIKELKKKVNFKLRPKIKPKKFKAITGKGQKGRGVVFYNNPQELLKMLAVILGEMEAGNTSIQMRNMGQTILDTLLENGSLKKSAYGALVRKYFPL